jgi:hypothetical protein
MSRKRDIRSTVCIVVLLTAAGSSAARDKGGTVERTDTQIEKMVRRSDQCVAMYNVNNKVAQKGGWNTVDTDTGLKNHTMRDIARPHNGTLYDTRKGFFIPNDRKKYSAGENGGMQPNDAGGIEIYIAADRPEVVPEEDRLPINRKGENVDVILRIYVPDLEKLIFWTPPAAEKRKQAAVGTGRHRPGPDRTRNHAASVRNRSTC